MTPRSLTAEQVRIERHEATVGAYNESTGFDSQTPQPVTGRRFRELEELIIFLKDSCETCAQGPTKGGTCSDYQALRHNERVCKTDFGRCVYSFPSPAIHRKGEKVECRYYQFTGSPEAVASTEVPVTF